MLLQCAARLLAPSPELRHTWEVSGKPNLGHLCSEHMNGYITACSSCADAVSRARINVCCCHAIVEHDHSPVFRPHHSSRQRLFWWVPVRQQPGMWSANHVMTHVSFVQDELEAAKREQEQRQHLCSGV